MSDSLALSIFAPADYNPRKITDAQARDLARSMDEDGDLSGIVFNVRSGHLVGGHKRIDHIRATFPEGAIVVEARQTKPNKQGTVGHGYVEHEGERFAVRLVDFGDEREMRASVKANRLGGEFDTAALADLLDHLASTDEGMAGIGFSTDDFGALLASLPTSAAPTDPANDAGEEWRGMPEYEQVPKAQRTIHVHFVDAQQAEAFSEAIGARITDKTRYVWFPCSEER